MCPDEPSWASDYRSLLRNIPGVTYRCACDEHWTMYFVNEYVEVMTGYPPSDFLHNRVRSFASIIHADDAKRIEEEVEVAVAAREPWSVEYRILRKDGQILWAYEQGQASYAENGDVLYLDGFIFDNSVNHEAKEALRRSEERLQFALDSSGDGVWDWNVSSSEVFFSRQWKRMLGYEDHELTGGFAEWDQRLHPDDRTKTMRALWAHFNGEVDLFEAEYRLRTRSGDWKWILARGRVIQSDSTGSPVRMLGTHSDIDDLKRTTVELQKSKEAAEAGAHAKAEFLAVMSHEIRTPLNGIIGMAELLALLPLSEEANEYTQTILSSGDHLLSIVNDILDFSKIGEGKLELESRPLDLKGSLENVVDVFQLEAQRKGLGLDLRYEVPSEFHLLGDEARIRQVLLNLVGNALKFTEEGGIKIVAQALQRVKRTLWVGIRVVDTGIGIPTEHQSQLFQLFQQVDASTTRRFGGTGLGLAISKRLAELMGGELSVESIDGRGSTFNLVVPLSLADVDLLSDVDLVALSPRPVPREGLRVLLVEDNVVNQRIATLMLRNLRCEVTLANNGLEAITASKNLKFDVIFMDCQMPEMDGFLAAQHILADRTAPNSRTPIIALTASALKGDRERCLAAGMKDYLTKPIQQDRLADAIQAHLEA